MTLVGHAKNIKKGRTAPALAEGQALGQRHSAALAGVRLGPGPTPQRRACRREAGPSSSATTPRLPA
eukprot:5493645-Lingulodinium_polyedra.AAC.1